MGSYIARRSLQAIFTLFLVMFLLHLLTTLAIQANGNPALAYFGDRSPNPSQLAAVEARYNLDDPCYDQPGNPCLGPFVERLSAYASGDLGESLRGRPITELIGQAVPNTLRLFVVVAITWFVVGMVFGTLAARFRNRPPDHTIRSFSVLIDAFPVFVMLLVYKFIIAVPVGNWMQEQFGEDSVLATLFKPSFHADQPWLTIIVPGILLGATGGAASFIRLVRASQLETYNADHVRTARAKGLGDGRVTVFHIIRNSSIPVITAVGFVFAEALSGAVITEGLMNIRGMGGLVWESVIESDVAVVISAVTLLAVVILVVNLIIDLAYAVLDPRIRYD